MNPILKFKIAVWTVIANLPLLNDEDFLFATINSFDSKAKEALVNSNKFSVFVSTVFIYTLYNYIINIGVYNINCNYNNNFQHKLICFKPSNKRTLFELESIKWIFAIGFKFFKLCPVVSIYNSYYYITYIMLLLII